MAAISRRRMLRGAMAGAALLSSRQSLADVGSGLSNGKTAFTNRFAGGVIQDILDDLCAYSANIGLKGVDLLQPDEYEVPRRHGLICTMGVRGRRRHWQCAESHRKIMPRLSRHFARIFR